MSPRYPPIGDYALISDCHAAALVSRSGSIDWCCLPRYDSGSVFGRLLDWDRGGHCAVAPRGALDVAREYLDGTLVLRTRFRTATGVALLTDCMLVPPEAERGTARRLLRVVEGVEGDVELGLTVRPRFDYGEIGPRVRERGDGRWALTGGDDGLLVRSDCGLAADGDGALTGRARVRAGERVRLLLSYAHPERLERDPPDRLDADGIDAALAGSVAWWRRWSDTLELPAGAAGAAARRSAIVLKGLAYEPTGAIAAAATTSLPEAPDGTRNWDYRYSWIRDSVLAARSLADLGATAETDAFRRFVARSTAGRARDLRVLYGVGGERRLTEREATGLDGYRGARPVRIGNGAAEQVQHDAYGYLLTQAWRGHLRGEDPDEPQWAFLERLVEWTVDHWREPDAGIWEWRGDPKHFVHSKAMCWVAVDRGLRLAEATGREVPADRWRATREEIRSAIHDDGYDRRRGAFVQALGESQLDAAVLRLPVYGLIDWDDERMLSTTDAVAEGLDAGSGLIRRYSVPDGASDDEEGAFLACCFWLAEALARQGRVDAARERCERAAATANDVGLHSEEHDVGRDAMLGNFPQALTHFARIEALLALERFPAEASG